MRNKHIEIISFFLAVLLSAYSTMVCAAEPKQFRIALQRTNGASDDTKRTLEFSPDGSLLALGGINLDIWSTKGYLARNILARENERFTYGYALLRFTRDGREIIAASRSQKTVYVYDAASGKVAWTIALGTEGSPSSLAISRDGKKLAIGTTEGAIEIWDYPGRRLVDRIQPTTYSISELTFTPDGKRLAYGLVDRYTIVRNGRSVMKTGKTGELDHEAGVMDLSGRKLRKFSWKDKSVLETVSFSASADVAVAHDKTSIWLLDGNFNVVKTTAVAAPDGTLMELLRVRVSPDGKEMVAVTNPGDSEKLVIFSLPGMQKVAEYSPDTRMEVWVEYTPDSRFICIARMGGLVRLVDAHTGALYLDLTKGSDAPVTADISPDGKYVASGGNSVRLWPIGGGYPRSIPSRFLSSRVIFSPDARHLVVSRRNGIEVTELDSGESRVFDSAQISPVALSPDGGLVAYMPPYSSARSSMRLAVSDVSSGKVLDEVAVNYCPVANAAFGGAGRFLTWGRGIYDLRADNLVGTMSTNVLDASRHYVAAPEYGNLALRSLTGGIVATAPLSAEPAVLRFSYNERVLAAGYGNGTVELWSLPQLAKIRTLRAHQQAVTDINFSRNGRFLVTSSADSTTRVWNLQNFNNYARFSSGDEWLIYTDDGYFDSSLHGESLAAMVSGVEIFGMEQFAARNNRPDIILGRMGLGSPEELAYYKASYLRRLGKLGLSEESLGSELHAPDAVITATRRDGKFLTVEFSFSDTRSPLKRYNVFVNNVPLYTASGKPVNGNSFRGSERIELTSGKNKIEVSATNAAGAESYRAQAYADYSPKVKGDLYYLGIGVSKYKDPTLALNYADKDAEDLRSALEGLRAGYDKIFPKLLLNSEATADNVKKAREFLAGAKTDDTVIVFVAGHGGYDKGNAPKYYYLPYEAVPGDLAGTGLMYDDLEELLDGIRPRKKLLLLDTCDSGELDEDSFGRYYTAARARGILPRSYRNQLGPRGEGAGGARPYLYERDRLIFNSSMRRTGAIVFSSSRGGEISYESLLLGNGFFTSAVISALTGRAADANFNGKVTMEELRKYVASSVAEDTGGLQHPTVDRDNIYQEIEFQLR